MEVKVNENDNLTELKFAGELTIFNINEIKDKLIESLNSDKMIRLNHDEVTEVDISYLQLLKSFCFTAGKKDLEVIVADNPTDVLKNVLKLSGIKDLSLTEYKGG